MIIKIFKISTAEMWTMNSKKMLVKFVKQETGEVIPGELTINQIVKHLPVEDYYRVK